MATPDKIDLFKLHKNEYSASRKPLLVEIRPASYLAIEGSGPPGSAEFEDKMGALYGMAYTLKMTRKFSGQEDYVVCKLEALYWDPEGTERDGNPPESLCWKLLIRTPDFVQPAELTAAVAKLIEKGKTPTVESVCLETLEEGTCVQMLHVGPYDRERESLDAMHAFMTEEGLVRSVAAQHEIYLSDPRRVAPEKLRTILRLPVQGEKG